MLLAIAEAAAEEILMEIEAWLTLGTEKAWRVMGFSQQNTHMLILSAHADSLLPALAALPACPVSLPHMDGAHKVQEFPILSLQ